MFFQIFHKNKWSQMYFIFEVTS